MTEADKRVAVLAGEHALGEPPDVGLTAGTTAFLSSLAAEPIEERFHIVTAHPSKWYRPRGVTPTSVVIHCTAATNPASSTAAYFASSTPSGSTQAIADDIQGFTMVPDDGVCAGAPPLNQEGLHIEQPGLATWTRAQWLAHDRQLRRVAFHVAEWCTQYEIPLRLLHAADLQQGGERSRGITYHGAVSAAFRQSTHTDPGPNYPWDVFMNYVDEYATGDDAMTPEETKRLEDVEARWQGVQLRRGGKPEPAEEGPLKMGWKFADEAYNRPPASGSGALKDHKHVPGSVQGASP